MFVKIKLSEKTEKVGNAHKTEAGKTFSLLHKCRIRAEYAENSAKMYDLSTKFSGGIYKIYNKNEGVKKMVKNISSDTTNSLDIFLIIIDNILYWSKCRCQFQLEFSTKAGGISAFSAEGNGIFMETEGK